MITSAVANGAIAPIQMLTALLTRGGGAVVVEVEGQEAGAEVLLQLLIIMFVSGVHITALVGGGR